MNAPNRMTRDQLREYVPRLKAMIHTLQCTLGAESEKLTLALNALATIKAVAQDTDIRLLADQALTEIRKP